MSRTRLPAKLYEWPRRILLCLGAALSSVAVNAAQSSVSGDELSAQEQMQDTATQCGQWVGQSLILPTPGDSNNYSEHNAIAYFTKFAPAGVFVNSYLYDRSITSEEAAKIQARSFHSRLRLQAEQAGIPPILIFADYERIYSDAGSSFPSNVLPEPQSAMLMTQTNNRSYIHAKGLQDGRRLKNVGVDALLGPVLDVDTSDQEPRQSMFYARMFGDNPETVIAASTMYATGLREAGLMLFPKHFPGYGTVMGSTELMNEQQPMSNASIAKFATHLAPFSAIRLLASGFTTSHAAFPELTDNREPATISHAIRALVNDEEFTTPSNGVVTGIGREDLLLVTDDVSDMGGVLSYLTRNKITLGEFAAKSIQNGHSLVLVSHGPQHLGRSATARPRPQFFIDDLRDTLHRKCMTDGKFRAIVRRNAETILRVKESEFGTRLPYKGTIQQYRVITDYPPVGVPPKSKKIEQLSEDLALPERLADKAMFWASSKTKLDLFASIEKVFIVSAEVGKGPLDRSLAQPFSSDARLSSAERLTCLEQVTKGEDRLRCLKARISEEFERSNALVFVLGDGNGTGDTVTLMEYALQERQKVSDSLAPKLVALVQTSPRYVPAEVVAKFDALAGNLSGDQVSIRVALEKLLSDESLPPEVVA